MENKVVGLIILGMSSLMGTIIFLFNRALMGIVSTSCSHGPGCPMWHTIKFHTNISIILMAFTILIGLYLIFSEQFDQLFFKVKPLKEPKKISKHSYKKVLAGLERDERTVFEVVIDSQGFIFQSRLINSTGFNKVKVSRLLDKLEGKGLVERRRRGMSNVVVLKH